MEISGLTAVYRVGPLEKLGRPKTSSSSSSSSSYSKGRHLDIPGFPRNASDGQLSAIKMAGEAIVHYRLRVQIGLVLVFVFFSLYNQQVCSPYHNDVVKDTFVVRHRECFTKLWPVFSSFSLAYVLVELKLGNLRLSKIVVQAES